MEAGGKSVSYGEQGISESKIPLVPQLSQENNTGRAHSQCTSRCVRIISAAPIVLRRLTARALHCCYTYI